MRVAAGLLLSGVVLVLAAGLGLGGALVTGVGVVLTVVGTVIGASALEADDALEAITVTQRVRSR